MGYRVESFEQIRRERDREREGWSIRELARRHGGIGGRCGRRWPWRCRLRESGAGPSGAEVGQVPAADDGWLLTDREAPHKQRHTAMEGLTDRDGSPTLGRRTPQDVRVRGLDFLAYPGPVMMLESILARGSTHGM